MQKTLKPCPHCGGRASLRDNYSNRTKGYFVFVRCDVCGATSGTYTCDSVPADDDWNNKACDKAIEAWNLRKYHDEVAERIDDARWEEAFLTR